MCLRVNRGVPARGPDDDGIRDGNPQPPGSVLAMREPPGYLGAIVRRMKRRAARSERWMFSRQIAAQTLEPANCGSG